MTSPFVCQSTELVACGDDEARAVCGHCFDVLNALPIRLGPTHSVIRMTSEGPRLMRFRPYWHSTFGSLVVTKGCLGSDVVTSSLDASFFPGTPQSMLPRSCRQTYGSTDKFTGMPSSMRAFGLVFHLCSLHAGIVTGVQLDAVRGLSTVTDICPAYQIGDQMLRTVDESTHSGHVVMMSDDPVLLQADYQRLLEMQHHIFQVQVPPKQAEVQLAHTTRLVTSVHSLFASHGFRKLVRRWLLLSLVLYGSSVVGVLLIPVFRNLLVPQSFLL